MTINELLLKIIKFRDDRNWAQFHNPKDLAISLLLETGEVLEHFQWKTKEEAVEYVKENKDELADELGDVFNYLLLLSNDLGIDLVEATNKKIEKNNKKYPVEKAAGKHDKYNKL
jgi:NTP pyrophosphatase (non-canonical NTP hydrolase)